MDLFAALVTFLRLKGHGGDRARVKTLQRDRITGLFTISVFPFVDTAQSRVDLGDQLALPVTGPEFQGAIGFFRCAVRDIRDVPGRAL